VDRPDKAPEEVKGTGVRKMPNNDTLMAPHSMAVRTEQRISAPAPNAKYGGAMGIKHIVVITIGRSRTRVASTASYAEAPSCWRSRGELDDQDGVFA
jgi:hypothetical protein